MTRPVSVVILHPEASPSDGPLARALTEARLSQAERHRAAFVTAGAGEVRIETGRADDRTPFGARLAALVGTLGDGGLVVLGSGSVPLATDIDLGAFLTAAAADEPRALANNRYSADIVAIARARTAIPGVPDLRADNGLPRWLAARGVPVRDRRTSWRLGVDIDGPLDLALLGGHWAAALPPASLDRVGGRLTQLRAVVADPLAEVLVAGRASPGTLRWLERTGAARTRALVEERGMRTAPVTQRPPRSALGSLLDAIGPSAFVEELERLGDAALLDTRVLMAHRHQGQAGWPSPEDRYASDLLLPESIVDTWLRDLTAAVVRSGRPILLGGHTLVGPGLRLAVCGPDEAG